MSLTRTYNEIWTYYPDDVVLPKPDNFGELHEIGLWMNRLISNVSYAKEMHEKDVRTIAENLKKVAIDKNLCGEFEKAMVEVNKDLFFSYVFAEAVDRCKDYKVTFTVHALNRHMAIDEFYSAVQSQTLYQFNYPDCVLAEAESDNHPEPSDNDERESEYEDEQY